MIVVPVYNIDKTNINKIQKTIQSIKQYILFNDTIHIVYTNSKIKKLPQYIDVSYIKTENLNEFRYCPFTSFINSFKNNEYYIIYPGTTFHKYVHRNYFEKKTCLKLTPAFDKINWKNVTCFQNTVLELLIEGYKKIYTPFLYSPFYINYEEYIYMQKKFPQIQNNTAFLTPIVFTLFKNKRKKIVFNESSLDDNYEEFKNKSLYTTYDP